ncbi:BspA family leucine-rich repeat surface protein [Belliella buryatensis]|nr:BspA family leucine-rich repeat surface protein [Belliella buryatensis]
MKKYFLLPLILLLFLGSCESEEPTPDKPQIIKKEKISGFIQKGPFVSGTTVTMNELNSQLVQTGKVFTSTIINDMGLFEVNNIELSSSFVEFTSSGFYFNEVSGEISISSITLTSLSDVSDKNSINVNVLTHLEKRRVETLMKEGKSFSESKTQSRNELLSVFLMSLSNNSSFEEFDISKNTEEGGLLLAISIILQGNRSVGQLTELLSRIQNDFSDNGKLDNENIMYSLRITTAELDLSEIRANIEKRFKELNINTPIPDFETQISKFLVLKNLNLSIEGEGTVEEKIVTNPSGREYPINTVVELTPVPKEGWVFDGWAGDLSGNDVPNRITLDSEKNVTVKFKRKDYPLNITIEGEGTVEERIVTDPNGRQYPFETVVELIPVPKEGWAFDGWRGDVVSRENPLLLTVKKETNITLKFSQPIFKILENGVTCVCEGVNPGSKGMIDGVEYEAVDNELLRKRRDEGVDLTKLCTSLVTDMKELFSGKNLNQPIGNWDVSNVIDMSLMFFGSNFNQFIGDWDVSNVNYMNGMFENSNFNKPIGNWDVSNVKHMGHMFRNSPFNQNIEAWNVSSVTEMNIMFAQTNFNQPIGDWDVSNVRNMEWMFANARFNQSIDKWDVSNVTTMMQMFEGSDFNQPIGNWDVSKVRNMGGMFRYSSFNQDLKDWNVSNVADMSQMFKETNFNQNISKWCVENITEEPQDFSTNSPLTSQNKPIWGTCPD